MSVTSTCADCGWTSNPTRSPAQAAHALRIHSCERHTRLAAATARRLAREATVDRTPKPCNHKQANHQHGTYAAYVLDYCRCHPCTNAASTYERTRKRQRAYGRDAYIDAGEAVAHIRNLQAAGLGWKRIAHLAGLNNSVIYRLLYGRPDHNNGKPRSKARPATITAILAVPYPTIDQLGAVINVPNTGTKRRLQALQALGWSISQIGARSGIDRQALDHALTPSVTTTTARTHTAIRDTYAALENTPPPETTRGEKGAAVRSRNRAMRQGWLAPAWWDTDTIDDPTYQPNTTADSGAADRISEWIRLLRTGEHPNQAAHRCGWANLANLRTTATRIQHAEALTHLDRIARERIENHRSAA